MNRVLDTASVRPLDLAYRPDVDGLRAIAVLVVLGHHLQYRIFSGGFVGVDIFFVISGYLITRIIAVDVTQKGRWDWRTFYERRIRRIYPALLVTCVLSAIASAFILSPVHFERFGGSLIAALLSVSNVVFWTRAGYFDAVATLKPLLHTWSLGVEEQFYLFWPLPIALLLISGGRNRVLAGIALAAIASLAANMLPVFGPTTIFYWMPFRIFEFAFGAALVFISTARLPDLAREAGLILGLALIGYAVVTFDSEMIFPSTSALIPCAGAALVIACGQARYSGWLLRNRLAVGIGLISYSLYLVHWPAIVLFGYLKFAPLVLVEKVGIVVFSFAAATAMFYFVEQPFRRKRVLASRRQLFVAAAVSTVAIVAISATMLPDGWAWRAPARAGVITADASLYGGTDCADPRCEYGSGGTPIVISGDSFGRQLYAGLVADFPDRHFIFLDHRSCTVFSTRWVRLTDAGPGVQDCGLERERLLEEISDKKAKVIFAYNWVRQAYYDLDAYERDRRVVEKWLPSGEPLAAFTYKEIDGLIAAAGANPPLIVANPPSTGGLPSLEACLSRPIRLSSLNCDFSPATKVDARRYLATGAGSGNATVIDPFEVFCDAELCQNLDDQALYYSDEWHLSRRGSILLISHFKDQISAWLAT